MTAAPKFKSDNGRRAMLAKIHLAKKDLRLDDDTYRDILERITGRRSSAECTAGELDDLVRHFRLQGFVPKVVAGGKAEPTPATSRPRQADHPAAKKARALWLSLADLGVVRERSESALEAFARRQLGVEKLQWADQGQTYKLIEALKKMAERAGWSQAGTLDQVKARLAVMLEAKGRG